MSLIGSSSLRGEHALFSPSSPSWLNYDEDQFMESLQNKYRSSIGTEIHEWAAIQIQLGLKCTSARDSAKSIKTMIFRKYYTEKYGLNEFGKTLLENLKYTPASVYNTVKMYVNDSVACFMVPEEILDYSANFFGTCDGLYFDRKKNVLRIFDLKTGIRPAKIEQLFIYEALFCLKNKVDPFDISSDLRIYQNEEVVAASPSPEDIRKIMDTIIKFDSLMTKHNKGGAL